VGSIAFRDATVVEENFRDSAFANRLVTSIPAPRELDQTLFHGTPWELADANWSPDFPTSASQVAHFYSLATGAAVDGVIDVDPVALSSFLEVLGPVQVAPYPQRITAGNALRELNYITNKARPGDPERIISPPSVAPSSTSCSTHPSPWITPSSTP